MSAAIVMIIALAVVIIGYQAYSRKIDREIIQADPKRATPAVMYQDGVDFMPASGSVLFGYQFKSIAALGPIVGPIVAAQWGWLPAILWLLLGVFFIGWVQDYGAAMMAMRNEGMTMGGLSYKFISPRARNILLAFLYFYLLLIMGAFGFVVAGLLANPAVPIGFIILTLSGVLAGYMTYKLKKDLVLTTVVTVALAFFGIWLGQTGPARSIVEAINGGPKSFVLYNTPYGPMKFSVWLWGIFALAFCYLGSVLPIWQFAQPVNYTSFWLVAFGIVGSIIGIFLASLGLGGVNAAYTAVPAFNGFWIHLGPLWPMLFVTISCGAISGWHSLVSTSGTARQLEEETDALPVGAGAMYSEAILGILSTTFAATSVGLYDPDKGYKLTVGAGAVFAKGMATFLGVLGIPQGFGAAFGSAFLAIMALTVMQLVLRFMRIASAELVGDKIPAFKNPHVGSIVAILFTLLILWTAFWQRIWVLFGGSNQLFAGLALLLITIWLAREGKPHGWTMYPGLFMYITTVFALLYTAYKVFSQVFTGAVTGAAFVVGNFIAGIIAIFLVIAAVILLMDGWRSLKEAERGVAPATGGK